MGKFKLALACQNWIYLNVQKKQNSEKLSFIWFLDVFCQTLYTTLLNINVQVNQLKKVKLYLTIVG